MKRASAREVQHNLAEVLRWVEDGEEVEITRRNRIVARLVPARPAPVAPVWPDFTARARKVWARRPRGKAVGRIIVEDREDRL